MKQNMWLPILDYFPDKIHLHAEDLISTRLVWNKLGSMKGLSESCYNIENKQSTQQF